MDDAEDKIEEILRRLSRQVKDRAERTNCPNEETLAAFLSGELAREPLDRVEAHLAQCSFCLEDLVAAYKSGDFAGIETIPQRLIDNAMGLVKGRETVFDFVVRLVKGSIELISTSARVIPMASPALRGEVKPAAGNALQVEHEVGRFRVAVELDLREAGTCQVIANVREETGEPVEGVRLSLSAGEREQASFLTRGGVVVFDSIAPGEYSIAISESGTLVGRIRLSLML
jgi:hypothetical protein